MDGEDVYGQKIRVAPPMKNYYNNGTYFLLIKSLKFIFYSIDLYRFKFNKILICGGFEFQSVTIINNVTRFDLIYHYLMIV